MHADLRKIKHLTELSVAGFQQAEPIEQRKRQVLSIGRYRKEAGPRRGEQLSHLAGAYLHGPQIMIVIIVPLRCLQMGGAKEKALGAGLPLKGGHHDDGLRSEE